jgi:hypothetical protein
MSHSIVLLLDTELLSGWPADEALHPDVRRMEGKPGQDPRKMEVTPSSR